MGNLYYTHIFRLYGLPDYITSDQETLFVNNFWARFTQRLGITPTAYHPETDGQTENANEIMEQYLRSFISY